MSEYMIGSPPQQVGNEEELWREPSADGTASLFYAIEGPLDDSQNEANLVTVETIDQTPRYNYPERMNELQRQYRARGMARAAVASTVEASSVLTDSGGVEDWRDTPYSELGGGLGRDLSHRSAVEVVHSRSLDENVHIVYRDYQPWMRDITLGVERYGLLDLTVTQAQEMTASDTRKAALYIEGYSNGLASIRQLVHTHEGVAEYHAFFDKYRLDGVAPDAQEFKSYMETLSAFEAILAERGAMQYFVNYAKTEIRTSSRTSSRRRLTERERNDARKSNKDKKGDTPRIRYDNKLQRHVVELIPRGSGIVPELY